MNQDHFPFLIDRDGVMNSNAVQIRQVAVFLILMFFLYFCFVDLMVFSIKSGRWVSDVLATVFPGFAPVNEKVQIAWSLLFFFVVLILIRVATEAIISNGWNVIAKER